jgi:hypothetical protein
MQISQTMLDKAAEQLPGIQPQFIARMLRNVTADGQLVFKEGEGHQVVDGKSTYPVYMQVIIDDPVRALELAQQLMQGAQRALQGDTGRATVSLSFAGDVMISE